MYEPAADAGEHAEEDDGDGEEQDLPPGHLQVDLVRPGQGDECFLSSNQGAVYSLVHSKIGHSYSLVLAVRPAVLQLGERDALPIVASPHRLPVLLNHQS